MLHALNLCSCFILSESNNVKHKIQHQQPTNLNSFRSSISLLNDKKWMLDAIFQEDTCDQTNTPQHLVLHILLRHVDLEEGMHHVQTHNLVQSIVQDLCRHCQRAKESADTNPIDGTSILVVKHCPRLKNARCMKKTLNHYGQVLLNAAIVKWVFSHAPLLSLSSSLS